MTGGSTGWKCGHCGGAHREKHHEEIPEVCSECGLIADQNIASEIPKAVNLNGKNKIQSQSWTEAVGISNSTEKQVALALSHLEEIADSLCLPPEVRRSSAKKYGELAISNFTDGRPTENVVGVTVYLMARATGAAIPLARVTEILEIPQSDVNKLARGVQAELELVHPGCKPVDYIDFLCADLGLDQQHKNRTVSVLEAYQEKSNTRGGSPAGSACAALYFSSSGNIPQRVFASAGGISQETLRVHLKSIRESGVCAQ
jgi:transcription initiation factor TFIIB